MATDPVPHLSIETSPAATSGEVVLALSGDLDPLSGPSLAAHVEEAAASGIVEGRVVLDLEQLAFIDSSGLRTLVEVHTSLQRRGARLVLRRPSRPVLRLLEITSLDVVFELDAVVPPGSDQTA
jgi:anti-sigma B factor antagonist